MERFPIQLANGVEVGTIETTNFAAARLIMSDSYEGIYVDNKGVAFQYSTEPVNKWFEIANHRDLQDSDRVWADFRKRREAKRQAGEI